jgi:predicted metalloprotease with PDZ domain
MERRSLMHLARSLGIGALSLVTACLGATPAPAASGEKQIEKRVRIVREAGGAYLGVQLEDVEGDDLDRLGLSEEQGALVTGVEPDSPAHKAGLEEGDVILGFQGERVHSAAQLARLVREMPVGRKVSVEVSRGGATKKLTATLAGGKRVFRRNFTFEIPDPPDAPHPPDAPEPPEPHVFLFHGDHDDFRLEIDKHLEGIREPLMHAFQRHGPRKLGISYQEISGQLAEYFEVSEGRGVLVTEVQEDGPAFEAGVKAGDVVLAFAGEGVEDGKDLRRELRGADPGTEVTITVQRDGKRLDLKLKVGGEKEPHPRHGPTT